MKPLLVLALLCASCFAQQSPSELGRWEGVWNTHGHLYDTPFSKASDATSTITCRWATNRAFMICDQLVLVDGKPTQKDVSVYGYDQAKGAYHFFGISEGATEARTPKLEVSGDTWTYSNSWQEKDKTVNMQTINTFKGADHVDWVVQFSTDGGKTWTKMVEGSNERVKTQP